MLSPYVLKVASTSWGKSTPLTTIMPTSFAGNLETNMILKKIQRTRFSYVCHVILRGNPTLGGNKGREILPDAGADSGISASAANLELGEK